MKRQKFMADFETCEWLENETYVWLWAVCNIETEQTEWNTDIASFIDFCKKSKNIDVFFHNLQFDGEFILSYLLNNGYTHAEKAENENEFATIISNEGQFYMIDICFGKKCHTKIYDSFKIIPRKVKFIPDEFGIDLQKTEIKYTEARPKGYIPTAQEVEYIINDVKIPARALKMMFDRGLTKITIAGNGLQDFKSSITTKAFNRFFPLLVKKDDKGNIINLTMDQDIRSAYRGGFTYLSPEYKSKEVGCGCVIDVNSLYPYIMKSRKLPIGIPKYFKGEYKMDKSYPLYVQQIRCDFKLKPNKIPTLQLKGVKGFFPTDYLEKSDNRTPTFTLTNVDLKLFFENYDVWNVEYIGGWKMRSAQGIFNKYIDKWYDIKCNSTSIGQVKIAKLMLNALYGKFGLNPICKSKIPHLVDDIVMYDTTPEKSRDPIYIPMAVFITSYAREKTMRTAQAIMDYSIKKYGKNKFIYSDTDSCHTTLSEGELKEICEIDKSKLGAWKIENQFIRGKFIRQKSYVEEYYKNDEKKLKICCAGLPADNYDQVNFENFKSGMRIYGKLTPKHVKGGIKLIPTTYEISDKKSRTMRKLAKIADIN